MALIQCPECHKDVSDSAFKCPSCGKTLKKAQRTIIGKVIKWLFILFNILMILWVIFGLGGAGDIYSSAQSSAEQAGAAIGTGLAIGMIATIWVVGDIIIGILVLLTRPKSS
ncbi:zinc ribbon domain-containing protein [Salmonella enterica]|nr:zinc ribbon domain-containing protein [Salmonella enterica]